MFCAACGTQQPAEGYAPPAPQPAPPQPWEQQAAPQQPAPPQPWEQQAQQPGYQQPQYPPYQQPLDAEAQDAQDNKVMAILSYFGLLALVPWFAAPNSKFARFHARQGLKLLLLEIGVIIIDVLLGLIKVTKVAYEGTWYEYSYKTTPFITGTLIPWILWAGLGVLAILGLMNALKGIKKAPPLLNLIPLEKISYFADK
jgi:hypothetical protein